MLPHYFTKIFFFFLLSNVAVNSLVAQCEYYGKVESASENCGNLILDFTSGSLLEISSTNYELNIGDLVTYSYDMTGELFECGLWSVAPVNFSCITSIPADESMEIMCNFADCVYPGDADADLKANAYDLLNIGLGYGTEGPPRPIANEDWEAQIGIDWEESTPNGINYKHLDCNGDGFINIEDKNTVLYNYIPEQNLDNTSYQEGTPELSISFDIDSLFITNDSPEQNFVEATIQLGSADLPVEDLHGLSFMLEYSQDLVPPHSVNSSYLEDSDFGSSEETLWMEKGLHQLSRNDLALSQKAGEGFSGTTNIITTSFVIIVDIIIGRAERETPFTVRLSNIQAVNSSGEPVYLNAGSDATFIIVDNRLTSINNPNLANQVKISPNPAANFAQINVSDLQVEKLEIFDMYGRSIWAEKTKRNDIRVNTSQFASGLYSVYLHTDEGLIAKKLMVR